MNPQAFPNVSLYQEEDGTFTSQVDAPGMALRDYFAAKAMQAHLSDPKTCEHCTSDEIASSAYMMADAMLKVRAS